MNVNLFQLFYHVAKYKSFSEASSALFISQPSISAQIKKLELQLDVQLFNRLTNGITLTKEGEIFYKYVASGMKSFDDAYLYLQNFHNLKTGSLKIGTSATIAKNILTPYLKAFHKKYPFIDVEIISGLSNDLIEQFYEGKIDVLILTWYDKQNSQVDILKICEINDVLICDKNIYHETKQGISIKEIENMPFIAQKQPSSTRSYMNEFFNHYSITPNIKMEVTSFDFIPTLVESGFGIAYSTKEFIQEKLQNNTIYLLNIKEQMPKRSIDLITKKTDIPNICVLAFIDIIKGSSKFIDK